MPMEAPHVDQQTRDTDSKRSPSLALGVVPPRDPSAVTRAYRRMCRLVNSCERAAKRMWPLYRWRRVRFDLSSVTRHDPVAGGGSIAGNSVTWTMTPRHNARYPSGAVRLSIRVKSSTYPITARVRYAMGASFKEGLDVWVLLDTCETRGRLLHLPHDVTALRLEMFASDPSLAILSCEMREVGKLQRAASKLSAALAFVVKNPRAIARKAKKALQLYRQGGLRALKERLIRVDRYPEWVLKYDTITDSDRQSMTLEIQSWSYTPRISIVVPVYNLPERFLRAAIESVRAQIYPHWELCIADDNSPDPAVRRVIQEYATLDSRIRHVFRSTNGHIAEATNSAAALATGEFIGFLDHDDELRENALFWVVKELQTHRDAQLLYSDEDKITEDGTRHYPHFKSDWNPELLLAQNYVCHFTVVRRSVFDRVGGIRSGFDGAQDWDFVLRVSEAITTDKIRHIPKILYHWRVIEGSTAKATEAKPYVTEAQIKAVSEHLKRIGDTGALVESIPAISMLRVRYPVPDPEPLVSLIVPTFNQRELLKTCVKGVLEQTDYKNIELIIVDNRSDDPATLSYLESLRRDARVKIIRDDGEFNFSRLNNAAARSARGDIVGFLNNDIQVIEPMWLREMVAQVVRPNVGAVGARLIYPHGTLQHAGVILGIGGVADHMLKHLPAQSLGYFCRAILPQNLSAVTAACMVVKGAVFKEVGGFNETSFGIAYNDIDLCLRIRQHGHLIVYTPYAELIHHESVSRGYEDTPEKLARFQLEFEAMGARWGDALKADPYYNPNLSLERADFSCARPRR